MEKKSNQKSLENFALVKKSQKVLFCSEKKYVNRKTIKIFLYEKCWLLFVAWKEGQSKKPKKQTTTKRTEERTSHRGIWTDDCAPKRAELSWIYWQRGGRLSFDVIVICAGGLALSLMTTQFKF